MHKKPNYYIILTPINKAIVRDLNLVWEYNYEEMVRRVKNGQGFRDIKSNYVK